MTAIVERTIQRDETPLDQVLDREGILGLRRACREVLVAQHVQDYAVDLVMATQPAPMRRTNWRKSTSAMAALPAAPRLLSSAVACSR